jgi:hypothetical protein
MNSIRLPIVVTKNRSPIDPIRQLTFSNWHFGGYGLGNFGDSNHGDFYLNWSSESPILCLDKDSSVLYLSWSVVS